MDMKRILQALDTASTQPVEGANDMKKFLSVVTEGANPHKVALPVQMAMQHYQVPKAEPVIPTVTKSPLLRKYFEESEEVEAQALAEKRERLRMYSQTIAERVLMKENRTDEIAGAFPSPSTKAKWAADAAASNAAEAKRQEQLKAQQLQKNTAEVDRLQKINHHSLDATIPTNETPIDMTGDANDPTIYGHEKANPMSLKGRIQQARNQLKELANMAESDDLVTWQKITQLAKGGMFMGLEQNLEQIRHGIEQLAAKRKQGGVASRGIDKNIEEHGALGNTLAWPEVVNKVNSAMKAMGWKGQRKDDGAFMFSTKGQETDDQWYMVVIENAEEGFFTYALGTVEEGDPHIGERDTLPNTEASVSELMNSIREGFGLNESTGPCWKNYKQIGMKKKGGKSVPNCVPKE